MRLCTFLVGDEERIGALFSDEKIVDLNAGYAYYLREVEDESKPVEIANVRLPADMIRLLEGGKSSLKAVHTTVDYIKKSDKSDLRDPAGRRIVYVINEIKLCAPIPRPPAILVDCWGRYEGAEVRPEIPTEPTHRLLAPSANALYVIGPRDSIVFPKISKQIFASMELGIVVGKRMWRVPVEKAHEYIAGYTITNDVTMFDILKKDAFHYAVNRAKVFPTAKPMGPWLVLRDQIKDPLTLKVNVWINDEIKQQTNTSEYKWSPAEIVSAASQYYPVEVGFIYLMGALPGVTRVLPKHGDVIKGKIEQLGVLENTVVAE